MIGRNNQLKKGFNYIVSPKTILVEEIITYIESPISSLDEIAAEEIDKI